MKSNLTEKQRNQREHRLDEIAKRTIELLEIIGLEHIILSSERLGITLHLAAEFNLNNEIQHHHCR